MATIQTLYLGDLRTEITHVQSGNRVITDAPTDNNGKGEYISPTDMVAAALGSCMLTLMGIAARRLEIDLKGTRVEIQKVMAAEPRRIAEIRLDFYLPGDYSDKDKKILQCSEWLVGSAKQYLVSGWPRRYLHPACGGGALTPGQARRYASAAWAVQAAGWERQFPAQKRPRCLPPQSFLPVGGGPGGCAGCCHRPCGNGKFHQT